MSDQYDAGLVVIHTCFIPSSAAGDEQLICVRQTFSLTLRVRSLLMRYQWTQTSPQKSGTRCVDAKGLDAPHRQSLHSAPLDVPLIIRPWTYGRGHLLRMATRSFTLPPGFRNLRE